MVLFTEPQHLAIATSLTLNLMVTEQEDEIGYTLQQLRGCWTLYSYAFLEYMLFNIKSKLKNNLIDFNRCLII